MEFKDDIKIYGAYENTNTKVITGHKNTKYKVGGTARHNIISNILDMRLSSQEDKIKLVSDIIEPFKLDEPINIQLRRLFYILKDHYLSTDTKFCRSEPKVRMLKLLDEIDMEILHIQKDKLIKIIAEITKLCDKRKIISKTLQHNNKTNVNEIIDYYKNNYKILYEIEDINIHVAQLLEKIAELLEQSEYIKLHRDI